MSMHVLRKNIRSKNARIAVVGLGYVGLPVACLFAKEGFKVIGVDRNLDKIEKIKFGYSPIEGKEPGLNDLLTSVVEAGQLIVTNDYKELVDSDVILISVETPANEEHVPDYRSLKSALLSIGPILKPGTLIIVESTIAPGTMQDFVLPLLETSSDMNLNQDFFLGHCPERVMPGKLISNLQNVSRVVGGMTPETTRGMIELYRHIVDADLDPTDCITAELVKTSENAYRDVQIAFANEVALICEAIGGDVWKVRNLVNKSPFRNMHFPGSGVGGHCIPKDPWLLAYSTRKKSVPLQLIPAARSINDFMPHHVIDILNDVLVSLNKDLISSRILILGYTYLENSDDTRNSPSKILVKGLEDSGSDVVIHDPFVPEYHGDLYQKALDCDAVVLMVRHKMYLTLDLNKLKSVLRTPIIVDSRNALDHALAQNIGLIYRSIGRGIPQSGNNIGSMASTNTQDP